MSPLVQIRLAELFVGVPYVLVWVILFAAWPGDDVAIPFLFSAAVGVTVMDVANRLIDLMLPARPRGYRRPWKAVGFGALVVVALVAFVVIAQPLAGDGSQRHQFALVGLICLVAVSAVLAWPPKLAESDPARASASETQPSA